MQPSNNSGWIIHDILALAVIALCALIVLAALIRPGAGFEALPLLAGAIVVVVRYYFGRRA